MILHITDADVSALLNAYIEATGLSQTEAIRRLLNDAAQGASRNEAKRKFREVAYSIVEKNRKLNLPPLSKEEADAIFERAGE
ncbi:MAG: hypothetical protein JO182_12230 [Acidobacteriaceae bacterium]|nr:hypothetical protein [Acidobacteriaceae bacterium]